MANHPGAGSAIDPKKRGRADAVLARASRLLRGRSAGVRCLVAFGLLLAILGLGPCGAAASPSPLAPADHSAQTSAPPLPRARPMLAALPDALAVDGTPAPRSAEPPRGTVIASLRMRLPAAVFRRGPVLWLVGTGADRPTIAYRHPSVAALPAAADPAVLRLGLGGIAAEIAAEVDGRRLVVEVRAGAARRPAPWPDLTGEGAVDFGATVPPIELLDPLVGDRLHVVLGRVPHAAAPRALRSTEAEILPSWLGAGLRLLDDRARLTDAAGEWQLSSQVAAAAPAAPIARADTPAAPPLEAAAQQHGRAPGSGASSTSRADAEPSLAEPAGLGPAMPTDRRLLLLAAPELDAVPSALPKAFPTPDMMPKSRPQPAPGPARETSETAATTEVAAADRAGVDAASREAAPASVSRGGEDHEGQGTSPMLAAATTASGGSDDARDGEPGASRSPKRRHVPGLGLASMGRTSAAERTARRRELSRMAPDEKPAAELRRRLELARLALADGLAVEAATTLAAGPPFDSGSAGPQESRRLLGAAAELLLGRQEAAAGVLRSQLGQENEEVWLWRAALSAKQGEARRAREEWDRSERVLSAYPLPLRARLAPSIARALIDADDENGALALVDPLLAEEPGGAGIGAINLLRAAALAGDGRIGEAKAYFAAARAQGDLSTRVRATFEEVVAAHKAGRLAEPAAADALTGEVPLWRGHADEPRMLARLAGFQAAAGRHAAALTTWQRALDRHPADEHLAHGPRDMAEILRRAVTEAAEHRRPALEAMALATSWRNYLPRDAAFQNSLATVAGSAADLGVTDFAGQTELAGSSASAPVTHGSDDPAIATLGRSRPLVAIAAPELDAVAPPASASGRASIGVPATDGQEVRASAADLTRGSSAGPPQADFLARASDTGGGEPVLEIKGSPAEVISTLTRALPALKQRLDLPSSTASTAR